MHNLRIRLSERYAAGTGATVVLHTRFAVLVWSVQKRLHGSVRLHDRVLYTAVVILSYRID